MLFGVLAVKETAVSAAVKNNKFKIRTYFVAMHHKSKWWAQLHLAINDFVETLI
jgi:hypothetical protein